MRKQYMGAGNMLHGGSFLNLQYIYGTLSNAGGENPLNFAKMNANPAEWYMNCHQCNHWQAEILYTR